MTFNGIPEASCPYEAPDKCNRFQPQSCCEKLAAGDDTVKPTGCPVAAGITPLVMQLNSHVVMCSALINLILLSAVYY